jgi:uncharacterized short protein YbdD (DUF466 family)
MSEEFDLFDEFRRFLHGVRQTGRLMVGIPDYDTYVLHRKTAHPDEPIMTYEEFFRERQISRYGGTKIGRCC